MILEEGAVFVMAQGGVGGVPFGPGGLGKRGGRVSALSPRLQIHVPWQKFLLSSPSSQVRGTLEVSTLRGGEGPGGIGLPFTGQEVVLGAVSVDLA